MERIRELKEFNLLRIRKGVSILQLTYETYGYVYKSRSVFSWTSHSFQILFLEFKLQF